MPAAARRLAAAPLHGRVRLCQHHPQGRRHSSSWSPCTADAYAPLRAALLRGNAPIELGVWPDERRRGLFATRDILPGELLLREPPYVSSDECPTVGAGAELALVVEQLGGDEERLEMGHELLEDAMMVALCLWRGAYEAADPPPGAPPLPPPPDGGDDDVLLGPLALLEHSPAPPTAAALAAQSPDLLDQQVLPVAARLAAEIVRGVAEQRRRTLDRQGGGERVAAALESLLPRCATAWQSPSLLRRAYHAVGRNKYGGIDGVGRLYLVRSFFNHGCASNVAPDPIDHSSESAKWQESPLRCFAHSPAALRAGLLSMVPVRAGEELTVSYFGVQSLQLQGRRRFLEDRFGFRCGCALCRTGGVLGAAAVQERLDVMVEAGLYERAGQGQVG